MSESLRQTSLSSISCPVAATHPIQASMISGLGCDNGPQGPAVCYLSQLSHLAKSSHIILPMARASPSSERPKEQSPNSPSVN